MEKFVLEIQALNSGKRNFSTVIITDETWIFYYDICYGIKMLLSKGVHFLLKSKSWI